MYCSSNRLGSLFSQGLVLFLPLVVFMDKRGISQRLQVFIGDLEVAFVVSAGVQITQVLYHGLIDLLQAFRRSNDREIVSDPGVFPAAGKVIEQVVKMPDH